MGVGYLGVRGESLVVLEFATLLVDPAPDADNSVLYTAKTAGAGGELVSIAYAAPAASAETTVAVNTNAITVTPGTKARMTIGGTLTPDITGALLYAGLYEGRPYWTSNSLAFAQNFGVNAFTILYYPSDRWLLEAYSAAGALLNAYTSDLPAAANPADATGWTPASPATGTPTVTAGISNAAQVIAAVNASSPAAALVTASESGATTGPVAAVAATNLILL